MPLALAKEAGSPASSEKPDTGPKHDPLASSATTDEDSRSVADRAVVPRGRLLAVHAEKPPVETVVVDHPKAGRVGAERRVDKDLRRAETEAASQGAAPLIAEDRSPKALNMPALRANAGDEQIGLVGRQVTLNGSRSLPRESAAFRWIQVGGPRTVESVHDGPYLSFTPMSPGVYRFALVVASGNRISDPSVVEVTVGLPPSPANVAPPSPTITTPVAPPPAVTRIGTEEFTRSLVEAIEGGGELAPALGSSFEAIAGRMDLYSNYGELFTELSRRIEAFLPHDPARRSAWNQRVFAPLTSRLVEVMRSEGLDLLGPAGSSTSLTATQKIRMVEQFQLMSQGFRSAKAPR